MIIPCCLGSSRAQENTWCWCWPSGHVVLVILWTSSSVD